MYLRDPAAQRLPGISPLPGGDLIRRIDVMGFAAQKQRSTTTVLLAIGMQRGR